MAVKIDPVAVGDASSRLAIQASAVEHVTSQLRAGAPHALPEDDFAHIGAELDALTRAGHELAARITTLSKEMSELARELSSMVDEDSAVSAALSVIFGEATAGAEAAIGDWDDALPPGVESDALARSDRFAEAFKAGEQSSSDSFASNPVNASLPALSTGFPPRHLLELDSAASFRIDPFSVRPDEADSPGILAGAALGARADEMVFVCQYDAKRDVARLSSFVTDGDALMPIDREDDAWLFAAPKPVKSLLWSLVDSVGVIERAGEFERISIPAKEIPDALAEPAQEFLGGDRITVRRSPLTANPSAASDVRAGVFDDELVFVGERGSMRAAFRVGDDIVFARVEEELLVGLFGLALGPRNLPPLLPISTIQPDTRSAIIDSIDGDLPSPIHQAVLNNIGLAAARWLIKEDLAPPWLRALLRPEAVLTMEATDPVTGLQALRRCSIASGVATQWMPIPEGLAVSAFELGQIRTLARSWAAEAAEHDTISLLARDADGLVRGDEATGPNAVEGVFSGNELPGNER